MRLPNFLVIGAPKAATTSLDAYLRQHPEVFLSPQGVRYFCRGEPGSDDVRATTVEEYLDFLKGADGHPAVGEVCARYLGSEVAAERIHEEIPDVKLVASLRNPVERAYSGYLMRIRNGRESRPVDECFNPEDGFVEGGFYYKRLRRYYDRFDRDRIRICLFDDLKENTMGVLKSLFTFLEVDPSFTPDLSARHNVGGYPKRRWLSKLFHQPKLRRRFSRLTPEPLKRLAHRIEARNLAKPKPLPPEIRERLIGLYRSDVERVQELIQRDLSHWLK